MLLEHTPIKNTLLVLMPTRLKILLESLESTPLGQRLASGAIWSLVGTLLARGLNMLAMVLVARLLGKDEFGEIGVIQSTMGMFQTLAGFGLGWAATKYVSELRKSDPARTGRIVSFSCMAATVTGGLIALVFFLGAPWLARNTLAAPHLVWPLQISSLILLLSTLAGTQYGVLAGFEAFRSIAQVGFFTGVWGGLFIIGGAWYGNVEGAVWGMIASYGLNAILNYRALRTEARRLDISPSWKGCWQERRVIWDYSLPAILGGTAYNAANWVCASMLVNRPGGYGEMGCYNAANQWFSALLFLPGVLGQAAIPVLSERLSQKDLDRSRKILIYSSRMNLAIIMPIVILGCLGSTWIMLLYGKEYEGAWPTLCLTLLAAGIAALQAPAAQVIVASGRMWMAATMNLSWALAFVISTACIIQWGSLGVATARIIAYCAYAAWSLKFAYSLTQERGSEIRLAR